MLLNDDEIDNEPIPEEATVDLRTADSETLNDCASAFVAQMYSSPNTTLTDVQRSVTCAKEVLDRTIDIVEEKMLSFIDAHSLSHDDDAFKTLMQELENGRKMFEDVDTPYKMTKYFSDKKCLVKPTDIFLGHRADTARKNGQMTQVLMSDTCQYIPIIDTIRFLFSSEKMQSLYMESNKSIDGQMRDYSDGAQFATHPLYSRYPDALQIQLYFDDVETTNPLGSKTKIHKMGAVYFSLRNLPAEYNSSLANIHLCLLFNSIDKETYGFTKILQPLLDDIKYLESHGIAVDIKGQTHLLYGTICLLTADNLACHSLCGYLESFSANVFCHFCLADKQKVQHVFEEDEFEKRTKDNYQQHVMLNNSTITGIKQDSCLNTLKYFHVTEGVCVDIMHDVLEGVAPLEVKLLLRQLIYEDNLFTLEQLNDRISSFDYGYMNEKNKPSVILNLRTNENAVRQTASQMWCLLLFLPLMIGDLVSRQSSHWKLFLLLREICSIIFAPVVTNGLGVFLKQLVIDHHNMFKTLYPDRRLIPKHHFMIHYGRMIVMFGPLVKLWCMRFESKHCPMKRQAHVVCNFKNISKTLAYKNQIQSMYSWKFGKPLEREISVPNAFPVIVGSLGLSELLLEKLHIKDENLDILSTVHVAHTVSVFGQTYRTGSVVPLKYDLRGECQFGEIIHILPECDKELFMFVQILSVQFFDNHYYAYVVEKKDMFELVSIKDLADVRPLTSSFRGNRVYLNPRYKIV